MTSHKLASAVDMYGATYRNFASELYAEIRAEAFGEDIGQTGWLTLTGIDVNSAGIAAAKANAARLGLSARAEFVAGNAAEPLPFADERFDAVVCIDAINHLPDRPAVFANCSSPIRSC
jgi:ubiquinone/menaquinone biosynthesis C-methylase UbiE